MQREGEQGADTGREADAGAAAAACCLAPTATTPSPQRFTHISGLCHHIQAVARELFHALPVEDSLWHDLHLRQRASVQGRQHLAGIGHHVQAHHASRQLHRAHCSSRKGTGAKAKKHSWEAQEVGIHISKKLRHGIADLHFQTRAVTRKPQEGCLLLPSPLAPLATCSWALRRASLPPPA